MSNAGELDMPYDATVPGRLLARRPQARPRATTAHDSHATATDRAAVLRLRVFTVMYAVVTSLVMAILRAGEAGWLRLPRGMPSDCNPLALILAGAVLVYAVTWTNKPVRTVLAMGTAYQLIGALCIGWFEQSLDIGRGPPGRACGS